MRPANAARRAFNVVPAASPPPVLGKAFNAEPVGGGEVFVSVPARVARASASVPGLKGRKFIPLREARQLPVGTIFDTRRGTVRLTSARGSRGAVQSGDFSLGVFQGVQSRKRRAKGLTECYVTASCPPRAGRRVRGAGVVVDERVEDHDYGRFGWASDPEGNRFELWEPLSPAGDTTSPR